RDGHCRHPVRNDVKNGKIVLVSSCGFWEMDNFEPMLNQIMAISKNINREFAGALLRPHGAVLKYMIRNYESVKDILNAARKAGHELVKDGKISQDTMAMVGYELMSREEYINLINENMKQTMD
ncbi:MAG: flavodoxin family protein, partial [Thermoplasmata archaeon]|nr:flavodoxin family protein [Thermoplasmata archaeon]